jgi:glycosyltransferase involved in cell wall biosynthesis
VVKGDVVFAVPGDLETPTGGYAYDRRMIAELRDLGWRPEVIDLGDGFPCPTESVRVAAHALLAAVPAGRAIVVDGLAFGVLPAAAEALRATHPLIALVHHPLALESGLTPQEANAMRASERAALACARGVVVTSPATGRLLAADYGVDAGRITVVEPGTDPPAPARTVPDGPVALLAVGAVVPRKGYDVLVAALASLADLPWHLTIVGDTGRDVAAAMQLADDIASHRLAGRIVLSGAVSADRLAALYTGADLFVLPSRHEGYGMAFAEAIAHGLPVVGTTVGAIPDTVPPDAGILVPPDDAAALGAALRPLIESAAERARLAAGARAAAGRLPTWRASAERFSHAIERAL